MPILPLFGTGDVKLQPLYVRDVAETVARALGTCARHNWDRMSHDEHVAIERGLDALYRSILAARSGAATQRRDCWH
jgi:hypothetical protein